MCLSITSLNSGSNGNCYYIGNDHEAIFVDAGISCREIEKRMSRLGLSIQKVKAVFVSHEHSDHISGIPVLAKKYQLPVYITRNTLKGGELYLDEHLVFPFSPYQPITVGKLSITAFPKFHDACDPHSFIVSSDTVRVGIFTDIGEPCEHVIQHFSQCHAAFLEANYDEDMLHNGSYPYYLKNRIRGGKGHLSNRQAFELFMSHRAPFMSHLLLSHLSKQNNKPELVEALFASRKDNIHVVVASRHQETPVFHITAEGPLTQISKPRIQARPYQLRLFS